MARIARPRDRHGRPEQATRAVGRDHRVDGGRRHRADAEQTKASAVELFTLKPMMPSHVSCEVGRRAAASGELPATKLGGDWFVVKEDVAAWLAEKPARCFKSEGACRHGAQISRGLSHGGFHSIRTQDKGAQRGAWYVRPDGEKPTTAIFANARAARCRGQASRATSRLRCRRRATEDVRSESRRTS
jgi:hypothetical protein